MFSYEDGSFLQVFAWSLWTVFGWIFRCRQWTSTLTFCVWWDTASGATSFGMSFVLPWRTLDLTLFPRLPLPLSCQWILSVLNKAIDKTVKGLESYQFSDATSSLHSWWLYELCDVFIEVIKPTTFGNDESAKRATRDTLWLCLDTGLRMLHPFMPYLTEELWQRLPQQEGSQPKLSICLAEYPSVNQVTSLDASYIFEQSRCFG